MNVNDSIVDFSKKIESLGLYTSQGFLRTVLRIVKDEHRVFNLDGETPAIQLEVAKKVETKKPMVLELTIGKERKIVMTSEPIIPGEPVKVIFKKEKFSEFTTLPTDFVFSVNVKNDTHVKSGFMHLDSILSTSVGKGGVNNKRSSTDETKTVLFSYDFHSDDVYALFEAHHLPVMTIFFEVTHDKTTETLFLESVRLVVWYNPTPMRQLLPPGDTEVFNVTRLPYETVSIIPKIAQDLVPLDMVRRMEQDVVHGLQHTASRLTYGFHGVTVKENGGMSVAWGGISDLAIAAAIQKLTKDVPGAMDDPSYIVSVLKEDRRGTDLIQSLVRIFGSEDKLPTIRQLLMHTGGLVGSVEGVVENTLDGIEEAASFMANTRLFSILPKFTRDDDVLEAELVIMLNLVEPVERAVAGAPFRINTTGGTVYDYAILAMLIKRISKTPGMTAQEIILKTLRLKTIVHWNAQYSRDGKALEAGPSNIHTLRNGIFSTLEALGHFVETLANDSVLLEQQVVDRVRDADSLFRTMVWQGMEAPGENPVPLFFRTSGSAAVYLAPHLGVHGAINLGGFGELVHESAHLTDSVTRRIFDQVMSLASFTGRVAADAVVGVTELGLGILHTTTADLMETGGHVSIKSILPATGGVRFASPLASVTVNGPPTVRFVPNNESPESRIDVLTDTGIIESRLVIDHSTGNIHRMGDLVDAESGSVERFVDPKPVIVDHTAYHGIDGVYYANPSVSEPRLGRINAHIQTFHSRYKNTPVKSMIQLGSKLTPKSIVTLSQDTTVKPFEQLPIQHCYGKSQHKSYYHAKSHSPYV